MKHSHHHIPKYVGTLLVAWVVAGCAGANHHVVVAHSHAYAHTAPSPAQPVVHRASTNPVVDAAREFDLGTSAYGRGQKLDAIAHFEAALRISPSAAVRFNLARVHEELHHDEAAARAYAGFLQDNPDSHASAAHDALASLQRLSSQLGWIVVRGDRGATIAGAPVNDVQRGVPIAFAPGARSVRACGGTALEVQLHAGDVLVFACGSNGALSLATGSFDDLQLGTTRELHAAR